MSNYDYHKAGSVENACRLLEELPNSRILAGGTDLVVDFDTELRRAENVISISELAELREIYQQDNSIVIGAGCTATEVENSPVINEYLPELSRMVVKFASPQIRNRATIAGNICSAVPCGDFPPVLISLGAEVELVSVKGRRTIPLGDYFIGNRETVREENEILTQIIIPMKPPNAAGNYQKFRRRAANSLAVASIAAYIEMDGDVCRMSRIVMGSVAPIPLAARKAGASLVRKQLDDDAISNAAQIASTEAMPITDLRGSDEYRRDLVRVLTVRALSRVRDLIESK
ncbi:MAG: xanthine dehydrogenase family protein subunit M [candidate division Zixibacteria bacterium]